MSALRDIDHQSTFKSAYLSPGSSNDAEPSSTRNIGKSRKAQVSSISQPLLENEVARHERPRINLDSLPIAGFGPWKVSLSSRADSDLRAIHKRDIQLFNSTIERIK